MCLSIKGEMHCVVDLDSRLIEYFVLRSVEVAKALQGQADQLQQQHEEAQKAAQKAWKEAQEQVHRAVQEYTDLKQKQINNMHKHHLDEAEIQKQGIDN